MELELAESWVMVFPFLLKDGGYPIPGILQSVRKRLNSKGLEETVVCKCEASVRKGLERKDLRKNGEAKRCGCREGFE
jgi:hypothetical protein